MVTKIQLRRLTPVLIIIMISLLFVTLLSKISQAGVDLSYPKKATVLSFGEVLEQEGIMPQEPLVRLFLRTLPVTKAEVNALREFIKERRKVLSKSDTIKLKLAFEINSVNPESQLYFDIDNSGQAYLTAQSPPLRPDSSFRTSRDLVVDQVIGQLDRISKIERRLASSEGKLESSKEQNTVNYDNLRFHINILYTIIGLVLLLGVVSTFTTLKQALRRKAKPKAHRNGT